MRKLFFGGASEKFEKCQQSTNPSRDQVPLSQWINNLNRLNTPKQILPHDNFTTESKLLTQDFTYTTG